MVALVTSTWCRILQLEESAITPHTDFRVLGGTSLQAAEIHAEIEDELGIYISHEMLNAASTVDEMACYILGDHPNLDAIAPQNPHPPPAQIAADPVDYAPALQEEKTSRQGESVTQVYISNAPPPAAKSLREQFGPPSTQARVSTQKVQTLLEAIVRQIWADILQLPKESIGLEQSFRSLGGTSLQAAEIHATLEDKLGGLISHEMLNVGDTIAAMGAYVIKEHPELLESLAEK